MSKRNGHFLVLASGRRFWPLDPRPDEVHIEDIATGLANLARFNGQTWPAYSVAQHSLYVSHAVPDEDAAWGLLHDAAEAYVGDLTWILKKDPELGRAFATVEGRVMAAVAERFGLPGVEMPAAVKRADCSLLITEARDLFGADYRWAEERVGGPGIRALGTDAEPIRPWTPAFARRRFLDRYEELAG